MPTAEFHAGAVYVALVVTGATASWVVWATSTEKNFYRYWARRRLIGIRALSIVAHGTVGVLAAFGAASLEWYPFKDRWFLNGLAYAAAAEGIIRANVAGLQVSVTGKIWSLANSAATRISSNLKDFAQTKISEHLSTFDDEKLAEFTSGLFQALRFTDRGKAASLEVDFASATKGESPSRTLLLRVAASAAADVYWKGDEDSP